MALVRDLVRGLQQSQRDLVADRRELERQVATLTAKLAERQALIDRLQSTVDALLTRHPLPGQPPSQGPPSSPWTQGRTP